MTANLPAPAKPDSDYWRVLRLAHAFADGRKSPHTRRAYRRDLIGCGHELGTCPGGEDGRHRHDPLAWIPWLYAHGLTIRSARYAHTLLWLRDLDDDGRATATQARMLAAMGSWYKWLIRDEQAEVNPASLDSQERPQVKRDRSPTAVLSTKQSAQLLAAADRDSPRAAALVALMSSTGMRVAELIGANVADIAESDGHPLLTIHGKGDKDRTAPLPPDVYRRIAAYLAARRGPDRTLPALVAGGSMREPLFCTSGSRTGIPHRLDQPYVFRLLRRLARTAGLDEERIVAHLSPHSMRHSYGTQALRKYELTVVQDSLGHASSQTTRGYDHRRFDPANHPAYGLMSDISHELDAEEADEEAD